MRDITGLDRVAEGAGWTQDTSAPRSMRWEMIDGGPARHGKPVYEPPLEGADDELDGIHTDKEEWMKQYEEWEPDAIRSLINTDRHETGHGATKNLYDMVRDTNNMRTGDWRPLSRNNQDISAIEQEKEESKTMRMLAELDNDRLARLRMKEPSYLDPMHRRGENEYWGPSGWHEYAAYLAELPNHPSYALGKWLKHSSVEQLQRRNALKRLAEAQKKWGEEPIDWKKIAGAFSPKADWWDRRAQKEVTDIMGKYPQVRPPMPLGERVDDSDWEPEYSDPEKAKKFLMPAGERIYRNLREAIIGQSYGTLAAAKDFDIDPRGYANQEKYQADRVKMAEKHGATALKLLNEHFKRVRQGKEEMPKTIKDLPEALRGEIARLELRRILAEQVGQQNMLKPDDDWQDPDKTLNVGWKPRTDRYSLDRGYSGWYADDWMEELANKIGLRKKGTAPLGSDAQYIPEEGAWADFKRFLLEQKAKSNKWKEDNPDIGQWDPWSDDYEKVRAKFNDDKDAWKAAKEKHDQDYRDAQRQYMQEAIDEMDRLGLGEWIETRVGDEDRWGDKARVPTLRLPYYYPPRLFDPSGKPAFVDYDKDPNAPVQIDDSSYGEVGVGTRANMPTSYYGIIPRQLAERLKDGRRSYHSFESGYGNQGNTDWLDDNKPMTLYGERMNTIGYDPIFDTWAQDNPDNWQDHPLAGKLQMTPEITGFTNPDRWALETKYPWNKRRVNWPEHRSGVIESPFSKKVSQRMIDEERQRLEDAGQHVPPRWRYEHTWEGKDEEGNYYSSDEDTVHFKRRGGKEREQPFKRIPMPRYEWDPVARAIAQAFMDREMEKVPGQLTQEKIQANKDRVARAMERNKEYYENRGRSAEDLAEEWDLKPPAAMRPRNLPITGLKWRGEIPITPTDIPDFDSELTDIKPMSDYAKTTIQDETLPRYSLRSFMEGTPQYRGEEMPRRKTLNELLNEIVDRRLAEVGDD